MPRSRRPALRILPASGYRVEPWRNGGGLTRVIAVGRPRAPGATAAGEWDWRLSLAEIARAGPFSALPGVARQLMLVDGGPLLLRVGGRAARLQAVGDTLRFLGTDCVEADPGDTPVRVLNLMWRQTLPGGKLELVDLACGTPPPAPGPDAPSRLLHLLDSAPAWLEVPVRAGDTVWLPARTPPPGRAPAARGILATVYPAPAAR